MYFPRVAGFVALAALIPALMAAPASVASDASASTSLSTGPAPTEAAPALQDAAAPPPPAPAPKDDDAAPQDDDAAPKDDDAAPQDGDAAPQDGDAAPQDGDAAPQDGDAAPQDGDAAPQDGDAAPQDDDAPAPGPDSKSNESQPPSPPPMSSKIVNGLNCTDFQANGTLQLNGRPLGFTGMPVTLKMEDKGDDVVFIECPSQTMDLKSKDSKHYGIVSPVAAPTSQCVRASELGKPQALLEIQDCSMSDDSSQMGQTFEYDDDTHSLSFVGRPAPGDFYQINVVNDTIAAVSPDGDPVASLKLQ
ncbi:hypothetical protein MCAP1_000758 [Malassezia caprae]|uniref:Ricin B lectin domain-containing protein n=1 Tax=Malassezia caprae TaxID=1381934 RepID=A0AAF0E5G2_9BASI|nr:hypothetical protein MCAP1_000758 [Malassezia caprae]